MKHNSSPPSADTASRGPRRAPGCGTARRTAACRPAAPTASPPRAADRRRRRGSAAGPWGPPSSGRQVDSPGRRGAARTTPPSFQRRTCRPPTVNWRESSAGFVAGTGACADAGETHHRAVPQSRANHSCMGSDRGGTGARQDTLLRSHGGRQVTIGPRTSRGARSPQAPDRQRRIVAAGRLSTTWVPGAR